jgi:signal transduction histidine kinase
LDAVTRRVRGAFPDSLRARLNRLLLVGLVVLAGITTVSTLSFIHLIHARHQLLNEVDPASLASDQLLIAYLNQETGIRGYLLGRNPTFLQPTLEGVIAQKQELRALNHSLGHEPHLLELADQAERQAAFWQAHFARPAIKATAAGNHTYATDHELDYSKQLFDEIRGRFSTLDRALASSRASSGSNLNSATTLLILVLAIGLALLLAGAVLLSIALRNWVIAPLEVLRTDARRIAQGDLSATIEPLGPTEINEVGIDVNAMRQRIMDELQEVATARQELARANEDLGRSNNELEQFAYVASHDLQEPLRKVTSFVQLLQERYRDQLDYRADQYIDFAVDGASRMQRLINELLAFSRIGRTTDTFVTLSMADCAQRAIENLEIAIREAGATVEVAHLPEIYGDPSLLTSLWQNLIGNAIKFRSDAPPRISIQHVVSDHEPAFCITDNGIGIEPRFAEKVFVIFQRLHGRESYEGTGIGLAMCKKIVEFHGGRIWLDPTRSSGTRICFSMPEPQVKERT